MPRTYANVWTAIWRDVAFCRLSIPAQRMYFMLLSQPDISAAGTLPLTLGRWARYGAGSTVGGLRETLTELHRTRFVLVDANTEELLVRSFVKWDGGARNPKRKPVIREAARAVESPVLRRVLVEELTRLGIDADGLDSHPDRQSDSHSQGGPDDDPEDPNGRGTPDGDDDLFSQVDSLSDRQSDRHADRESPSERVVVTKGLYLEPQTTNHNPQPLPTAPGADAPSSEQRSIGQRSKAITDAYYAVVPLSKWAAVNSIVKRAVTVGDWTDDEIHDALMRLAADNRSVTIDALRIELGGGRQPSNVVALRDRASPALAANGRRPSATDRAVAEAWDVVRHFEALETQEKP